MAWYDPTMLALYVVMFFGFVVLPIGTLVGVYLIFRTLKEREAKKQLVPMT